MSGTLTTRDLVASSLTVSETSTGAYRIDIGTQPPTIRASDGTSAWALGGGRGGGGGGAPGARDLAGFQLQQGLRLADFSLPLTMKQRYGTLQVNKAYDTIAGRQVVVLTGTPAANVTEQLSFDRETGLLARRTITTGSGGVGFGIMNLGEHDRLQRLSRRRRDQGGAHGPPRDVESGVDREVHRRQVQRRASTRFVRQTGGAAAVNMPSYSFRVNGRGVSADSWDANEPLLYVLRNQLGLYGAKYGCGMGQCGTCTVLIDGATAFSCLVPVSKVVGKSVTTIEGLGTTQKPDRVQAAFVAEQAAQCGYCTSGMIVAATALLARTPRPTREQIQDGLAGNLCRCGTHTRIIDAVLRASGSSTGLGAGPSTWLGAGLTGWIIGAFRWFAASREPTSLPPPPPHSTSSRQQRR